MFFIGTTAEYIKVFTVIEKVKELCQNNKNISVKIVTSGQNEISDTDIARTTNLKIDLQLSYEKDIVKNAFGLLSWYCKTRKTAVQKIKEAFPNIDYGNSIMVVHGDTISTVMGAKIGERLGMEIAHIEAGLRSHNIFSPFPEEIDRHLVSKIADYNFCQNDEAYNNLQNAIGEVINTHYNTIIDALNFSEKLPCQNPKIKELFGEEYGVFVLHRQENLLKPKLVKSIVNIILEQAQQRKVVFILHTITKNTLISMNLLKYLEETENVILFDRVEYFDFMKLLSHSQFVVTDGGSNQEELSYMGKPTMIVRTSTERNEGLGQNVLMYNKNIENIKNFIKNYKNHERQSFVVDVSPSATVADKLCKGVKL